MSDNFENNNDFESQQTDGLDTSFGQSDEGTENASFGDAVDFQPDNESEADSITSQDTAEEQETTSSDGYSSWQQPGTDNGYSQPAQFSQPYNFGAGANQGQQGGNAPQYNFQQGQPQQPYGNADPNRGGQYGTQPYNFSNNAPVHPTNPNGSSSKGKKVVIAIVAVAIVVAIFAAVTALTSGKQNNTGTTTTSQTTQAISGDGSDNSSQLSSFEYSTTSNATALSAVDVAKKARGSVVGVMTYSNGQLSGEGSGVAMSCDGTYTYIITCAHVISDKGVTFGVLTLEGKSYEAEMVAYDARTDIGVVKVSATDIPLAEFGDSSTLQVGETVYAIGNPGGSEYFGSMTDGIISAIDRSVSSTYNMTCIQHNAAINPGNSGGALLNSAGQVIGINSSKIAATDYEGMGFAVPMSIVKPVVDNLIQYGYVPNRPKLGIEYASVSSYQLYSMVVAIKGLPSGSLVIAGISSDSSLAGTDAQVGDLIIGVNGQPMDTSDVLLDLINTGAVGDTITLNLCRVENRTYKTKEFNVTITLVEDRGTQQEETTVAVPSGGYDHGGASSFEDFFNNYFGF